MKQFLRCIFYTKVPLGGYYRYRDIFQIFPAEFDNMPKSNASTEFVNVMELWVTKDEIDDGYPKEMESIKEVFGKFHAQTKKQDSIMSLLTVFGNNKFYNYKMEGTWAIPIMHEDYKQDEGLNARPAKWSIKTFNFPELGKQMGISDFTKMKIPPMQTVPMKEFYLMYPNLDYKRDKNIVLPETIDYLFDSYFNLPKDELEVIDVAIRHNHSAVNLHSDNKTLSLLASFTALEALVNMENKDVKIEQCECCKQPKYGISKKFREFLLKYIGDSDDNRKKFNSYYTLRSKIVHAGRMLQTEKLYSNVSDAVFETEAKERVEILQIGKIALANWLITKPYGVNEFDRMIKQLKEKYNL